MKNEIRISSVNQPLLRDQFISNSFSFSAGGGTMLGDNEGNTTYTHNKSPSDASTMSVNVSDRATSNGSIKQKVGALPLSSIHS